LRVSRVVVAALIALLVASPALAGPEDVASRISNEVMSPFCDGVTLHDCPSAEADELRREIATWARAGMSEQAILDRLEREYGVVRGTPDSAIAWLLPSLAVLGGVVGVLLLARRWANRGARAPTHVSAEERRRIDAELGAYRGRP
jgi:cytochrome c-type biogenesis protein CcmH/NrfF